MNVFFNVKDKHGMLIPNLTKNDFEIYEDGKPQTVKYFSAESDQPLTLGIMIDTSASQTRVLTIEQILCRVSAGGSARQGPGLCHQLRCGCRSRSGFHQQCARPDARAEQGADQCRHGRWPAGFGGGPVPTTPRGTLLYDAIYLGANEKLRSEVGRKAMIVFTDGEDQGSRLKIQDAIEAAQKADTICYVILIADRGFYGNFGYSGDFEMKKLAEQTGGRVIEVGNKQEKLRQAFEQIQNELRSQYNIGYTPTNTKLDGSYRKIQIKAKGGEYKTQARQGYYAMGKD